MPEGSDKDKPLRIFVCGAHSVGKSTLLEDISKVEKSLHYEKEVARNVIKELKWKREDFSPDVNPENFEKLQIEIIKAQTEVERRNRLLGKSYMADRSIDPVIYAKFYLNEEASLRILQLQETQESIERYRNSLNFVIYPHEDCIAEDNIRLPPRMGELIRFTQILEMTLKSLKIPYTVIDVLDLRKRREIVLKKIQEVRNNSK